MPKKRRIFGAALAFIWLASATIAHPSAVHTLQVTIGASVTQVSATQIYAHSITFQNNQTHTMRVGDGSASASRGALLGVGPPGGAYSVTISPPGNLNLSDWWVAGTQNDVLDVIYVD